MTDCNLESVTTGTKPEKEYLVAVYSVREWRNELFYQKNQIWLWRRKVLFAFVRRHKKNKSFNIILYTWCNSSSSK